MNSTNRLWLTVLAIAILFGMLAACASKRAAPSAAEAVRAPIKKIAILPIGNPRNFTLEKTHSPIIS